MEINPGKSGSQIFMRGLVKEVLNYFLKGPTNSGKKQLKKI